MKTRKTKLLPFALVASLFLVGCEMSTVESVRGGFLSGYDTMTVGDAFDGWSGCIDTSWQAGETDRNEQVVQYSCAIPNFEAAQTQLYDAVAAAVAEDKEGFEKQVNDMLAAQAMGAQIGGDTTLMERLQNGDRYVSNKYLELLAFQGMNYIVEFTLSKRDDSFDVTFWGLEFVYADGTSKFGALLGDGVDTILNTVYQNMDPKLGENATAIDNVLTANSITAP